MKKIKELENIFRQIAEEKPYLTFPFNEKKFYEQAKRIFGKNIKLEHVQYWLSGYRRRNPPRLRK